MIAVTGKIKCEIEKICDFFCIFIERLPTIWTAPFDKEPPLACVVWKEEEDAKFCDFFALF